MLNKIKEKIRKSKDKKKGFTLVELLAVIVILAVIMVITIPTVLGNMKEAKQSAFNTVGETMIKYLEDNYKNCKLGNKDIAKYDDKIFNDKCELQYGDLSEILIGNSGYSTDDIESVKINNLSAGKFGVVISPKNGGDFSNVETYGFKEEKCWSTELVGKNEYKFVKFHGINKDTGYIVEGCESYVTKTGETYSITIPSTYLDKQITTIGNNLFQGIKVLKVDDEYSSEITIYNKINSVVIEEGITTIEDGGYFTDDEGIEYSLGAFQGTGHGNLTLHLPSTLTHIGNGAFCECGLKILELPSGLKTIGIEAFISNDISSLKIPSSVESIKDYAFSYNPSLTSIEFIGAEDYTSNLKNVGDYAFSDCNLDYQNESYYLQIPNEITSMGSGAFANNSNLKYIRFTGDTTGFGEYWNGSATLLPRRGPV